MGRRLGARPRPGGLAAAVHDRVVDPVLDHRGRVLDAPQPLPVGLVLGKEQLGRAAAGQPVGPEPVMGGAQQPEHPSAGSRSDLGAQLRAAVLVAPGPGVPEPERWQDVQRRGCRPAVGRGDADQDILGTGLRVLHVHIEVPVLGKGPGVDELVLGVAAPAAPVLRHQVGVGEGALRVLVERPHVRMRRGAVQEEVVLLDILAVIPLGSGQSEGPLLQDGIGFVPQGEREAEQPAVVADSQQPVLAPSVRPRARVVVRKVVPGRSVGRIVFAHGPPLSLRQVRPPEKPRHPLLARFGEPAPFGVEVRRARSPFHPARRRRGHRGPDHAGAVTTHWITASPPSVHARPGRADRPSAPQTSRGETAPAAAPSAPR